MRLILPGHHHAARPSGGAAAGPWANPFDDPTGTILWSRWVNGSTSGTAKGNCALWSKKQGFSGSQSACEWRTNSGTGRANVELLNWEAMHSSPQIIRMRCKVETYAVPKLWLLFNTIFADPLWELFVDVTPDGTAPADRIGYHSPEWSDIWVEEHPAYPGWIFIKARLDLTSAADVDGSFTVHMTDGDQSDVLFPLDDFTMLRVQDLTVELA